MRHLKKFWIALGSLIAGAVVIVTALNAFADVPQPVLTIAPTGSNQLLIVITNGTNTVNYEIYRTPVLSDPDNYPFLLHAIGGMGQTNFVIDMGSEPTGFVLAAIGSDWDGDGIENYRDANPSNPNIGVLTVTINSPTNSHTFY